MRNARRRHSKAALLAAIIAVATQQERTRLTIDFTPNESRKLDIEMIKTDCREMTVRT